MNYTYDATDKVNCWYKKVCQCDKCEETTFCIRHYKMHYLIAQATLEGKQRFTVPLYPEDCDKSAFMELKEIQNHIEDFVADGKNLLIYSQHTGNGKSEWAKKLLLSYFGAIWHKTDFECRGLFISLPKLMFAMRENISTPNEYFKHVNEFLVSADLVVWDELNYKEMSAYEHDYLLNIISQRVAMGKSNIYTSNYGLATIEEKLGTRLASRIVGASEVVEFKGLDKRGMKVSG